jgi:TonB family protein
VNYPNRAKVSTDCERNLQASVLVPIGKPRWRAFAASTLIQCAGVGLLLVIPLLTPKHLVPHSHYFFTPLMTTPFAKWRPVAPKAPTKLSRIPTQVVPGKVPMLRAPVSEPRPMQMAEPPAIRPESRALTLKPVELSPPRPAIRTGILPHNILRATLVATTAKIQTGGFGKLYGLPAVGDAARPITINPIGSFDMPVGPARGDAEGGGIVANAGFGSGIGAPSEAGRGGQGDGAIEEGFFADARPRKQTAQAAVQSEKPNIEPVEILYEPIPVYTAKARTLRIEGVVVLEIVFTASREVKVLRIVQGLGHGLSQAALAAARQIRFEPERVDGRPVDSQALLRVVFQLAY